MMPLMVVAAIGVASSMIQANQVRQAAKGAANAQEQANERAMQYTQGMYTNAQTGLTPFISAGQGAMNKLTSMTGPTGELGRKFTLADFTNSPGFQFQMNEGLNAIQNSAAARGGAMSGAAQKALAAYSTGMADQSWNTERNAFMQNQNQNYQQLMGMSNLGANAATNLGHLGMNAASLSNSNFQNIGNAQANQYATDAAANNKTIGAVSSALSSYVGGNMPQTAEIDQMSQNGNQTPSGVDPMQNSNPPGTLGAIYQGRPNIFDNPGYYNQSAGLNSNQPGTLGAIYQGRPNISDNPGYYNQSSNIYS